MAHGALAQAPAPDLRLVDSSIVQEMRAGGIPGAAVVVVSHGRVIYSRGFGVASVETGLPVDSATLFRIASTSKMMTAAGILALVGRGSVSTSVAVSRYVRGISPCVGAATLSQLLSHTGGLADSASEYGPHDETARGAWIRAWPCTRAFLPRGQFFSYSNLDYDLLGQAIQEVSGIPYAAAMDSLVFRPTRMTRTTLIPTVAMTYPLAVGYAAGPNGPAVVRPAADDAREWPSGGVFTNAADYGRFLEALLSEASAPLSHVGGAMLDSMRIPRAQELDTRPERRGYIGYGFNVRDAGGYTIMQHAGSMHGYGSVVRVIPEDGFAVALLANRTGAVLAASMVRATELVTGRAPPPPLPPDHPMSLSARERNAAVGVFGNGAGYLTLHVFAHDSTLWLRQEGDADSSRVDRIGSNEFITDGTFLSVTRTGTGRVEFVHIAGHTLRRMPAASVRR